MGIIWMTVCAKTALKSHSIHTMVTAKHKTVQSLTILCLHSKRQNNKERVLLSAHDSKQMKDYMCQIACSAGSEKKYNLMLLNVSF